MRENIGAFGKCILLIRYFTKDALPEVNSQQCKNASSEIMLTIRRLVFPILKWSSAFYKDY